MKKEVLQVACVIGLLYNKFLSQFPCSKPHSECGHLLISRNSPFNAWLFQSTEKWLDKIAACCGQHFQTQLVQRFVSVCLVTLVIDCRHNVITGVTSQTPTSLKDSVGDCSFLLCFNVLSLLKVIMCQCMSWLIRGQFFSKVFHLIIRHASAITSVVIYRM